MVDISIKDVLTISKNDFDNYFESLTSLEDELHFLAFYSFVMSKSVSFAYSLTMQYLNEISEIRDILSQLPDVKEILICEIKRASYDADYFGWFVFN